MPAMAGRLFRMTERNRPSPSKGSSVPTGKLLWALRLFCLLAWLWLLVAIPFLTDAASGFAFGLSLRGSWMLLPLGWLTTPIFFPASLRSRAGRHFFLASGFAGIL